MHTSESSPSNMEELRKCKRCLLYELAEDSAYKSIKSYLEALPSEQKVPDEEYFRRLQLCKECEFMLSAMCRKCGCYCEVRAAHNNLHCPGEHPRW